MQCVVLAGGLGTRLGSLTADCPKPMLPVAERPFLEHLICHAARFGFKRFLILAGYRSEVIRAHFLNGVFRTPGCTVEIDVCVESEPLGTAGALRNAFPQLEDQFMLINGDTYFSFNWAAIARPHEDGVLGCLALRTVDDASRYGVVTLDDLGRITHMLDRPRSGGPGVINGGAYFLSKELVASVPDKTSCSLEEEIFPKLVQERQLSGRVVEGAFIDIGIPSDFELAQTMLAKRKGAVFFDRDGVLNHDAGYVHKLEDFEWLPGAREAVREVNEKDMYAFVVTNQAGVGRGYYTEGDVRNLHEHMQNELAAFGAHIDDFRFCPHHEESTIAAYRSSCHWRKPCSGMLLDLCANWDVDMARSVLFGDKQTDLDAAMGAGVPGHLVTPSSSLHDLVKRALV